MSDKPIPERWREHHRRAGSSIGRTLIEELGAAEDERDKLREREKDLLHALNVNGKNLLDHSDAVNELSAKNRELVRALDEIVGHATLTLIANPDLGDDICQAYSRGANDAFAQMAAIARDALRGELNTAITVSAYRENQANLAMKNLHDSQDICDALLTKNRELVKALEEIQTTFGSSKDMRIIARDVLRDNAVQP